jgi:hypothetical protein
MRDGIDVEYYISAMTVESELMKHVERDKALGRVVWVHKHPKGETCVPECFSKEEVDE